MSIWRDFRKMQKYLTEEGCFVKTKNIRRLRRIFVILFLYPFVAVSFIPAVFTVAIRNNQITPQFVIPVEICNKTQVSHFVITYLSQFVINFSAQFKVPIILWWILLILNISNFIRRMAKFFF